LELGIQRTNMNEILLTQLQAHKTLKKPLLNLINKQTSETDKNESDSVSRLDWTQSENFDREWVKYFMPHFKKTYQTLVDQLGFDSFVITGMWFQQYQHNDVHEWHTHSDNYTGVYYLEMPNPIQTLIYCNNEIKHLPVSEGDFVIFPSHTIHKAPINKAKTRKTIISFNVNFKGIQDKLIKKLQEYERR